MRLFTKGMCVIARMKLSQVTCHVQLDGSKFEELWMVYKKDLMTSKVESLYRPATLDEIEKVVKDLSL